MKKLLLLLVVVILCSCQKPAIQQNPSANLQEASQLNMQLGLDYLAQRQYPEAQQKLILATQEDPKSAEAWAAFAYFFQKTHRPELAKRYYQKAIDISPNATAILNNYGAFLCQQNQVEEGLSYLKKAKNDITYLYADQLEQNIQICKALGKAQSAVDASRNAG